MEDAEKQRNEQKNICEYLWVKKRYLSGLRYDDYVRTRVKEQEGGRDSRRWWGQSTGTPCRSTVGSPDTRYPTQHSDTRLHAPHPWNMQVRSDCYRYSKDTLLSISLCCTLQGRFSTVSEILRGETHAHALSMYVETS